MKDFHRCGKLHSGWPDAAGRLRASVTTPILRRAGEHYAVTVGALCYLGPPQTAEIESLAPIR